jgi:Holliday junction DNA helicase RuvA
MISLLSGVVRSISTDKAIVEVAGVGYSLSITSQTSNSLSIGAPVTLFTTLVVREDSLTLFGFADDEARVLFELLQTVSGIGPKVALSILNSLTPDQLARSVATEDISAIEKVPGIGRKGAQRLILELKGKIAAGSGHQKITHQPAWREQLTSALVSLGFSAKDSDLAISTVIGNLAEEGIDASSVDISELLKLALQSGRR